MVCLHGGAEQEGISGTVRVTVLYTPENETGVRALEFAMPFTVQGEGLADCAHVSAETEIELLESRMLNPRKIFTRCKLVTHLTGYRKVCLTISADAEAEPGQRVEKRCCGQNVTLLRQVAEKDLTFSETMSLSLGREGAAELLHCRTGGTVTETKVIGNKLIFKGVFLVAVLYRTTGGQLASASSELPFSQIMEIDSIGESAQVSMRLQITGADIQIDGADDEGRQLAVTIYYHTMALLREIREVTLLTDLYSTAYELRYEPCQLDLCSLYDAVTRRQTVREVLEIGVAAESILSLCADCGAVSVSREGDTTQLRTAVTVRALYLDEGGACLSAERCIDVCCPMELCRDGQGRLRGGGPGDPGGPGHRSPVPGGFPGGVLRPEPEAVRIGGDFGGGPSQGPVRRAVPDPAVFRQAGICLGGGEAVQHHHSGHSGGQPDRKGIGYSLRKAAADPEEAGINRLAVEKTPRRTQRRGVRFFSCFLRSGRGTGGCVPPVGGR